MDDPINATDAEAALRASEQRLAGIVDAAMDAIISIDAAQRIVVFNPAAEQMFGYPAAAAIGQTIDQFIPHSFRAAHAAHIRAFGETGVTSRSMRSPSMLTALRADGTELPIEATIARTLASGQPLYSVIMRDISARVRAEAVLRASEERFHHVFLANPSPEVITRADSRVIVDANSAFAQMTGYALDELIGQTTDALGLWLASPLITEERAQLRQFEQLMNREIPTRMRDGSVRDLLLSVVPVMINGAACFLTVMVDQTDRKHAEQALQRSAARLRVLADAARSFAEVGAEYQVLLDHVAQTTSGVLGDGCAIHLLSDDGLRLQLVALYDVDVEHVELFRRILGDDPFLVVAPALGTQICQTGQPILIPVVDREQLRAALPLEYWATLDCTGIHSLLGVPMRVQGQTIGVVSLLRYRRDQPPFDEDDLTLAQDLADRAALAISNARLFTQVQNELTERKHAQAALAQQTEELTRSNAELEQFAYVASHDLQEPLRMVASYTQLLSRRYKGKLDTDADEFIAFAVDGATRMQTLINDLLAYSRLNGHATHFEPIDCALVVDQACANLEIAIAESQARVTYDRLPTVRADSAQLTQVFQNLIGNAIKFCGSAPPQIHIAARQRGAEWVFTVSDNGIGIDPLYAARIFIIFQRLHTRAEYSGTGIGLAICKKIIENHGGHIWVEPASGPGSRFAFTLPRQEDDHQ